MGAGSAGCVLAERLSAQADCRVVLIEAGPEDRDGRCRDPQTWPFLIGGDYDWGYVTEPQSGLGGRRLPYPRGKVIGGSSAINALGHQRGHPAIFDDWERAGCVGWGFADLLPYFKASETFDGGQDAWRGAGGPIDVIRPARENRSALAESFVEGARQCGHAFNPDFNGARMAGVAWNQLAISGGVRASEATAFVEVARSRPNLTIRTGATVLDLVFEGDICVGVRAGADGAVERVLAAETLLCAGAIDSPRLLMLSGVGGEASLGKVGVKTRVDAPGVGLNLQDHPLCGVVHAAREALPASHYNHGEAVLFASSGLADGAAPDVQIMMVDAPFTTAETGGVSEDAYSLVACLMRPQSRGSVVLVSSDPSTPAMIDPSYLSTPRDIETFMAAFTLAEAVGASPAMARWRAGTLLPRPGDDPADYVRRAISPFFHPVGTCRMGGDETSVVDLDLRVRGVRGLRVIDASVIPIIPNAMPNAAVVAIALKAADSILGA